MVDQDQHKDTSQPQGGIPHGPIGPVNDRAEEQAREKADNGARPRRVNIANVEELRYWTKSLGVSSDALVSAVREVGHDPDKVIECLRRPRAAS